MNLPTPVKFSPDLETIKPDEQETVLDLIEQFDIILEKTAKDYGHAVRSVHAKAHGVLEGKMIVQANLPPELAQGLFAKPGEHNVYMRLSTNAGDILPDAVSLPRGLALKVVDVEGDRLADAEGTTQDFVMVNGPVFQAPNPEKFLSSLKLLARTTDRMEGTKTVIQAFCRRSTKGLKLSASRAQPSRRSAAPPTSIPSARPISASRPFALATMSRSSA